MNIISPHFLSNYCLAFLSRAVLFLAKRLPILRNNSTGLCVFLNKAIVSKSRFLVALSFCSPSSFLTASFLTWWNCGLWVWWRSTHKKIVFGSFWITWLVPEREGPLLASSGTALERPLLCGKHYDIMQVDLIDLMEQADVVLKPSRDETQPVLGDQNHILKKWNNMSMSCCSRSMISFEWILNIPDCWVQEQIKAKASISPQLKVCFGLLLSGRYSAWLSISVFHLSCVGSQG